MCAVLVFATWQYRLLCVLLVVLLNRQWLKEQAWMQKYSHSYKSLVIALIVLIFISIPNYWQRGRTQLHYLDDSAKRVSTPVWIYLTNVIAPEEEVMNICMKAVALMPNRLIEKNKLAMDAKKDFWRGRALGFYRPYNRLSWQGSNPGSFTIAQTANMLVGTDYDAVYVTRPKGYDADKKYPLVVFCHGYMGSWELYQGILSRLKNCVVISIGTRKLDGLSFKVGEVFSKYMPYLESIGYQIDDQQVHLIGLSNGGQAANSAWTSYDKQFKSITFLSTFMPKAKKSSAKVLLVGGGRDGSCGGIKNVAKQLKNRGTDAAYFYQEDENHYIFAYHSGDIIEFFNREMGLTEE